MIFFFKVQTPNKQTNTFGNARLLTIIFPTFHKIFVYSMSTHLCNIYIFVALVEVCDNIYFIRFYDTQVKNSGVNCRQTLTLVKTQATHSSIKMC